jgi:hypothetical protein
MKIKVTILFVVFLGALVNASNLAAQETNQQIINRLNEEVQSLKKERDALKAKVDERNSLLREIEDLKNQAANPAAASEPTNADLKPVPAFTRAETTGATDPTNGKLSDSDAEVASEDTTVNPTKLANDALIIKPLDDAVEEMAQTIVGEAKKDKPEIAEITPEKIKQLTLSLLTAKASEGIREEADRQLTQFGADSKSSGTTSLVSRGGVPKTISASGERGAALAKNEGTAFTFNFNPVGFTNSLLCPYNKDERARHSNVFQDASFCRYDPEHSLVKFFKNTSFGFVIDTSDTSTETRQLTTGLQSFIFNRDKIQQVSFRWQFGRRNSEARRILSRFIIPVLDHPNNTPENVLVKYNSDFLFVRDGDDNYKKGIQIGEFKNKALREWFAVTRATFAANLDVIRNRLAAAGNDNDEAALKYLRAMIRASLEKLPLNALKDDEELLLALGEIITRYQSKLPRSFLTDVLDVNSKDLDKERRFAENVDNFIEGDLNEVYDKINRGRFFSFDYTNNRERNAPDTSNFRLVGEFDVFGLNLTTNSSFSLYHSLRDKTGAKKLERFRDVSIALQLSVPLPGTLFGLEDEPIFSLSGRYQRMTSNAVDSLGTLLPFVKGDIFAAQLKVSVPLGSYGFRLPLSFTYANRPELFTGKEARGNFGLVFDLTTILERFPLFFKPRN